MTGLTVLNEAQAIREWRLYIVQEYCDGGSLRQAIEAQVFYNNDGGEPQMVSCWAGGWAAIAQVSAAGARSTTSAAKYLCASACLRGSI